MQQVQTPPLNEGESYGCGIVDRNGDITYTILLPGDHEGMSRPEMMAWAKSIGGDLPTLAEQALMRELCPDQFQARAYWSNRNDGDGCAWYTDFSSGDQYWYDEIIKLRGRAVRRVKG